MIIVFAIALLVQASLLGIYVGSCCLLPVWLVFGKTPILVRAFSFGAVVPLLAYITLAKPAFSGWEQWPTMIIFGISCLTIYLALLRWMDLRLISLTSGLDCEALERSTGKSMDEWMKILVPKGSMPPTTSRLTDELRSYGIFDDQIPPIIQAVKIRYGLACIEHTDTNEELYVDSRGVLNLRTRFRALTTQKASLKQWFIAYVVIAIWCMFLRYLTLHYLDARHVGMVLVIAAAGMVTTTFVLFSTLSMRRPQFIDWLVWFLAGVGVLLILREWSLTRGLWQLFRFPLATEVLFVAFGLGSLAMLGLAVLVRRKGYRLVWVRRFLSEPSEDADLRFEG